MFEKKSNFGIYIILKGKVELISVHNPNLVIATLRVIKIMN